MKKNKKIWIVWLAAALLISILPAQKAYAEKAGYSDTAINAKIDGMTLRQKITQMMMVDFRKWDTDLTDSTGAKDFVEMNEQVYKIMEEYDFGAVVYFANNIKTTEQAYALTMEMQEAATKDGGIPLIIATDQEGGSVYRLGSGTALPGNMALGATGNTEYAEIAGEIIGSELSVLGINTTLAPVVDINNNANNPVIGLRSYGDNAEVVGQLASATIQGLKKYNVIGCAKHFPGHGDTATDSHYALPSVNKSKEVLLENELKPYEVAISEGIEMIMTAHILYPQLDDSTIVSEKTGEEESLPATMSKAIITDLLKSEMGFTGIVVTDAMNMSAISSVWNKDQAMINAINAGIDMLCMPYALNDLEDLENLDAIIDSIEKAVSSGKISEARINDAVKRILTVKANRGILEYHTEDYSLAHAQEVVGSEQNRQKERAIAAAAVTVVKNEDDILPLKITETSKVLMLCPYNNETGQLVMGWNRAKQAGLIPEGAEMDYHRFSSSTLTASIQEKIDWADTILVISEATSASVMAYDSWKTAGPNNFVNYASENNKKTIIMSADKPYDVQLYPNANAILAVYGCKGSSIDPTEAIVGSIVGSEAAYGPNIIAGVEVALGVYGAQGKLPVSVPKFDNSNDTYKNEIVFERGYGLRYNSLLKSYEIMILELEETEYSYDGNAKTPLFTVRDGNGEVVDQGNVAVEYKNNVSAGTATITVSGKGDYTGTVSKTFTISPQDISEKTVQLDCEEFVYDGAEKRPAVTIANINKGEDYLVNYVNDKGIGTAKVILMGTGNYTGTIECKYTIKLQKPEIKISAITGSGKLDVTWDKVLGTTGYAVYRSVDEGESYKKIVTTTNLNYLDKDVTTGYIYYYKVKAIYNNDSSANSDYSNVEGAVCALKAPVISITRIKSGKPKISWNVVEGADKYEVYRATSVDGIYKKMFTTTKTNYTNTSAEVGKTYYYKVKAVLAENENANSDFSNVKYTVCALGAPASSITKSTAGKPKVTWNAVENASKYEVYRATSAGGAYKKMFTTTKTSYTNTDAVVGKTYYYKVKAIYEDDSNANSKYSNVKYTTCALKAPKIDVTKTKAGKPKVTWKAIEGVVRYEVYRATSMDGIFKKIFTTTNTSYTNTGALTEKTYYYKVRAIYTENEKANSVYSSVVASN